MTFVIVVAVALVASISTIANSIGLTVLTMYGYNKFFTVLTPRSALVVRQDIVTVARNQPLVEEMFVARPAMTVVKTVFGKMPFVVFGLNQRGREVTMRRCGLTLASGRMVEEGRPEVVLHADIARNKKLKLGDIVLEPNSEDSYSLVPARLVGTLKGPVWLALTSEKFVNDNFPVAPSGYLVMAPTVGQQSALDKSLDKVVDKAHARTWTYGQLVRETNDALTSLYLIMTMVISILVFAIAFLTGMLTNIYFTQRLPEFATLAAIGYKRSSMLWRVGMETGVLCIVGWILGSILNVILLLGLKRWVMEPRGLLLDPWDWTVYLYTLPLPVTILAFALVAIGHRLRRLDPVSIIERRA